MNFSRPKQLCFINVHFLSQRLRRRRQVKKEIKSVNRKRFYDDFSFILYWTQIYVIAKQKIQNDWNEIVEWKKWTEFHLKIVVAIEGNRTRQNVSNEINQI